VRTELDLRNYVEDLERHLQLILFSDQAADPEGAVLLVRGAVASGDRTRAAALALATQRLAALKPSDQDMAAAASHACGLVEQDPAALDRAASCYSAPHTRAWAWEDAGNAWARRGDQGNAVIRLRRAHALYDQMDAADEMARVRSSLRAVGIRLRHGRHADRPAFGWESLTDTERRVADLVAQGFSNREVAGRIFLSSHTVAFHLRQVYGKLGITSRVQLARMAAERAQAATHSHPPQPRVARQPGPAPRPTVMRGRPVPARGYPHARPTDPGPADLRSWGMQGRPAVSTVH
jgi:DNA-binding CsgD family transcriptional regulator